MDILIADDHPLLRHGIMDIVRRHFADAHFTEVGSAQQLFVSLRQSLPQLVILDLTLPDRHGLDCLTEIKKRFPQLAVLVLSMHAEEVFALRALEQGAMGYLTKDRAVQEIATAIERIRQGRRYIGPDLAEAIAARRLGEEQGLPHEKLSEREFRVLRELASGTSLALIAEHLSLSPKTVTTYRARVLTKLALETNAELVRYCLDHHLID